MDPLRLDRVGSVLCLGAHADDIEIGCGGTVMRILAADHDVDVTWVVLSGEGERGVEARRSAERFLREATTTRIEIRRFRDAYFPFDGAAIKDAVHAIAGELDPDLVLTHRLDDRHQDHRVVAELTWNAFRDHTILEYEIPKYEGDGAEANVLVPLESRIAEAKIEALLEGFPSQRSKPWFRAETFRATMTLRGNEAKSPSGYAEGFVARKLVL